MTNRTDDAAANKAAETGAANKAAEKKGKSGTRVFKAAHHILRADGEVSPGEKIELTRAEWEALSATGSVEGVWEE